ncbi:hypothetical protein DPEC_G00313840 [Dallia pectoralis]|uniref:Uncharacterized protein n=1 Tax=Dallia pectoralis TaxID=75939 RepID=A0ACC2FC00_DALPE|nr:hypothetical protein DPEC_G00313840 [Dallia pectoralis]
MSSHGALCFVETMGVAPGPTWHVRDRRVIGPRPQEYRCGSPALINRTLLVAAWAAWRIDRDRVDGYQRGWKGTDGESVQGLPRRGGHTFIQLPGSMILQGGGISAR